MRMHYFLPIAAFLSLCLFMGVDAQRCPVRSLCACNDGRNGTDGRNGLNGLNGRNGTDGKDGISPLINPLNNSIVPAIADAFDVGSLTKPFANVYTENLNASVVTVSSLLDGSSSNVVAGTLFSGNTTVSSLTITGAILDAGHATLRTTGSASLGATRVGGNLQVTGTVSTDGGLIHSDGSGELTVTILSSGTLISANGAGVATTALSTSSTATLDSLQVVHDSQLDGNLRVNGITTLDNGAISTTGTGQLTAARTIVSGGFSTAAGTLYVGGATTLDSGAITTDSAGLLTVRTLVADNNLEVQGTTSLDNAAITTDGQGDLTAQTITARAGVVSSSLNTTAVFLGPSGFLQTGGMVMAGSVVTDTLTIAGDVFAPSALTDNLICRTPRGCNLGTFSIPFDNIYVNKVWSNFTVVTANTVDTGNITTTELTITGGLLDAGHANIQTTGFSSFGSTRVTSLTSSGNVHSDAQVMGASLATTGSLSVAGASSLDAGAIFTNGAGVLVSNNDIRTTGNLVTTQQLIAGSLSADNGRFFTSGSGDLTAYGSVQIREQLLVEQDTTVDGVLHITVPTGSSSGGWVLDRTSGPSLRAYALASESTVGDESSSSFLVTGLTYTKLTDVTDQLASLNCGVGSSCVQLPSNDLQAHTLDHNLNSNYGNYYYDGGASTQLQYTGWHTEFGNVWMLAWTPHCSSSGGQTAGEWNCALIPLVVVNNNPFQELRWMQVSPGAYSSDVVLGSYLSDLGFSTGIQGLLSMDVGNEINWANTHFDNDFMATLWVVDDHNRVYLSICRDTGLTSAQLQHPQATGNGRPNCRDSFVQQTNSATRGQSSNIPPTVRYVSSGGADPSWVAPFSGTAGDGAAGRAACNVALLDGNGTLWYGQQSGASAYMNMFFTSLATVGHHICTFAAMSQPPGVTILSVAVGYDIMAAIDNNNTFKYALQNTFPQLCDSASVSDGTCFLIGVPAWTNSSLWTTVAWPASSSTLPVHVDAFNSSTVFVLDSASNLWQLNTILNMWAPVALGPSGPGAGTIAKYSVGPDSVWATDTSNNVWRLVFVEPTPWTLESFNDETGYAGVLLGKSGATLYHYNHTGVETTAWSNDQVKATQVAQFTSQGSTISTALTIDGDLTAALNATIKGDVSVDGDLIVGGRIAGGTFSATVSTSNVVPRSAFAYDVGTRQLPYLDMHAKNFYANATLYAYGNQGYTTAGHPNYGLMVEGQTWLDHGHIVTDGSGSVSLDGSVTTQAVTATTTVAAVTLQVGTPHYFLRTATITVNSTQILAFANSSSTDIMLSSVPFSSTNGQLVVNLLAYSSGGYTGGSNLGVFYANHVPASAFEISTSVLTLGTAGVIGGPGTFTIAPSAIRNSALYIGTTSSAQYTGGSSSLVVTLMYTETPI